MSIDKIVLIAFTQKAIAKLCRPEWLVTQQDGLPAKEGYPSLY